MYSFTRTQRFLSYHLDIIGTMQILGFFRRNTEVEEKSAEAVLELLQPQR